MMASLFTWVFNNEDSIKLFLKKPVVVVYLNFFFSDLSCGLVLIL